MFRCCFVVHAVAFCSKGYLFFQWGSSCSDERTHVSYISKSKKNGQNPLERPAFSFLFKGNQAARYYLGDMLTKGAK